MVMMEEEETAQVNEDELEELVRKEVEACFAGLETALATGDEEAALALIQTQGKQVLNNVLEQLDSEGKLLSNTLSERLEELASTQRVDMLKKFDEELAGLQQTMAEDRETIRQEMQALEQLNEDYKALQSGGGISFNRDKIVASISFVAGISGLGAAINEALKIALGAGGDATTIVLNLGLGAGGIGYYFVRNAQASKK